MIVFTIYENGGNTGVLGASFSCALFGVQDSSGVNAGRSVVRAVMRAQFVFCRHSSLRFDHQRDFGFRGRFFRLAFARVQSVRARIRSVRELWRAECPSFYRARFIQWARHRRL